jgi:ribonuclease BN (tRNA processing enzyme)
MAGRHHTSWTLQMGEDLFFFDAGECCSYTAHLLGLDLLKTRAIFISHPHMDHVGGLPNLLWTMRKLTTVRDDYTVFELPIFTPLPGQAEAIITMLQGTEGGFNTCFNISIKQVRDGQLIQSPMLVEARHNSHLKPAANGDWQAFSFRVSAKERVIAYSGDIGSIRELDGWSDSCDLLMMETGHHSPREVCAYLEAKQARIGRLLFVHHGRSILNDPAGELEECRKLTKIPVDIAEDRMSFTL